MIKNFAAAALLLLAAAATGCGRGRASSPDTRQGVVEYDQRAIGFELAGRVRTVSVQRGDVLAAGVAIATLDDGLAKPVREARAAELRAAEAQVALLRAGSRAEDVRATEAQLAGVRETEAVVRRNYERVKSLADGGVTTPTALDEIESQRASAEAQRRVLEQRLALQRAGARKEEIAAAEAKASAAKAALAAEDERLARFTLVAPMAGTVLDVHLKPGEVAGAGTPVVTLADTKHPYVDVFVPEGALAGVRVGVAATVRVDASGKGYAGHVENVSPRTEFTPRYLFSERERPNLVVRVRVRVDDGAADELHAGVPAEVVLAPTARPAGAEVAR